jgi:hypothetical protein
MSTQATAVLVHGAVHRTITAAAADPSISKRTWVLATEAVDGGWGLAGHTHTNAELVSAARAQLAELAAAKATEH